MSSLMKFSKNDEEKPQKLLGISWDNSNMCLKLENQGYTEFLAKMTDSP
jgi:hypothetical protein